MIIEGYSPIDSIPSHWEWSTIGEECVVKAGNPAPQGEDKFHPNGPPFVRVVDMGKVDSWYIADSRDHLSDEGKSGLRLIPKGTVLFTKSGASLLLNQRAILERDMYVVSHIGLLSPKERVTSEWVYLWMSLIDFGKMAHATTLPSMPLGKVKKIRIPIAPLNEQDEIVEIIRSQQLLVESSESSITQVELQLDLLRSSILNAACKGKLIPNEAELALKENRDYEPADQLLERILSERRARFEAENPRRNYKEPVEPDITKISYLPEGWSITSLDSLCEMKRGPFGSAITKAMFVPSGYSVYEQYHAISGDFTKYRYKITPDKYDELIRFSVEPGDFIISCAGTIGKIKMVPDHAKKGVINQALLRIRIDSELVRSKYFLILWRYMLLISSKLKVGSAMSNMVSVKKLKIQSVLLPPLIEQDRIISYYEVVNDKIDFSTKKIRRLDDCLDILQLSILSSSFAYAGK